MSMRKHKRKLVQRMARRRFGRWTSEEIRAFNDLLGTFKECSRITERMRVPGRLGPTSLWLPVAYVSAV